MAELSQLQNLQNTFATLSVREKRLLAIAGVVVTAFIVFLVVWTFGNRADAIRARMASKLKKLDEVQELAAGYREARARQEATERQLSSSNVRIISYLEERASQRGLELPTINPKADLTIEGTKIVESGVELTLTDVKLNRLIDFMQAIEAGPGIVKVKYLRLEPRVQNETVTAWLTVATYRLKN